jgi:RNA polymerase sigma-70 factor, ECF subfamily
LQIFGVYPIINTKQREATTLPTSKERKKMIKQLDQTSIYLSLYGNESSEISDETTSRLLETIHRNSSQAQSLSHLPSNVVEGIQHIISPHQEASEHLQLLDPSCSEALTDAATLHQEFERLVMAYHAYLLVLAFDILGNWPVAEDVVQDAWTKFFSHLKRKCAKGEVIDTSHARGWLGVIVRNAAYTYRKQESKHHSLPLETLEQEGLSAMEEIGADKFDQPIQRMLWQESRWTLEELISTLPMQYRKVILLRFLYDLSYEEIATALQKPLGTVKCYQHRGLDLLRQKIKQWGLTREDLDVWSDYSRYDGMLWNYISRYQRIEPGA